MYKKVTKNQVTTINECWTDFFMEKSAYSTVQLTLSDYQRVFTYFLRDNSLTGEEDINVINKNLIYSWIMLLKQKDITANTINHYIKTSKVFFNWLSKHHYIPPIEINLLKAQEEKIKFYTTDELSNLLTKPDKNADYVTYRTWVIINFILATGARAGTLVEIKQEDIDFTYHQVVYRHLKNKKLATIPLHPSIENILRVYIKTWDTQSEYLFSSVNGDKLTTSALRQSLNRYCTQVGVNPRGPHALRHSFAREFIKNGGSSLLLQKFLTHSSVKMSQHYVNLFADDLQESAMGFVPIDKLTRSNKKVIKRATL